MPAPPHDAPPPAAPTATLWAVDLVKALAAQLIVWHHFVSYGPLVKTLRPYAPAGTFVDDPAGLPRWMRGARGNGTFDNNEVALPGITVILGQGACPPGGIITPADRLATTISDAEGVYRFEGLDAGIYCISIEALSAENVDLLIPGNWTFPAPGTGRVGIRLASGEERLTVDFGWEFQE